MRKLIPHGTTLALLAGLSVALVSGAAAHGLAAPTIGKFSPRSGGIGSKVTISGTNLAGASVSFSNSVAGSVTVNKWGDSIVATVGQETPSGPGFITVTTPGGVAKSTLTFTVTPGSHGQAQTGVRPQIVGFSPMRGKPGTKVTLTGKNFAGATMVKVGGVRATFVVPTATKLRLTVPAHAASGKITAGA